MANENAATIIIRNPHDITIGITNTDLYDIILLPQADGVADGGRVITVYNALQTDAGSIGGPSNNDSHDVYSLTLGKDDAYLAIGGNYVDNFEEKFAFTGYAPEGYCDNWHPGPIGDIVIDYDEDGNPYKVSKDYSAPVTYMVDANYNVHHLAYSVANKENGAIRFSGNKGTLVLTAQNGAKNSADYTESKYNKYYDITIDLSEFANVKEGDYLCYSVDGGEIKRVKVGAGNSVVISGDAEINQYSKVEWYVVGETKIGGTTKFDIPSYGESMAESLISQMFGSSSADRIPFFSVLDMVNNSQYSNMLGGSYDYLSALDAGADYMYISINGGEYQKLAVENGMVYIEGHEFKASDTFEWYFVSSNDVLTDTYTIAGIDTGLDVDLSMFDKNLVTAGCKFVYKVDGVEQSAIEITEEHLTNAVSIGDNVAIKNGSKIEWYITDADGNRLTNTQVIENVNLADVQEFSAEYRKDQLRIDLTDFIARAGSFESYSVSYVVKNGGAFYTKEVVITGDANGRYIFAVDDIGQNAVVDYQVFGKNGSSKMQIGEDYSATVTDGELVADESSISADIKTKNSLTVDLSAYFRNEVTDFNDPKIFYTFAGAKVVRDTDGRYIAEISGIDGDTEYKLQRHRKTSLGTDTATLFDDYRFNEEKQCFEAVDCVIENNNTAIDITGYLGTLGDVNMPYVVNEISFRVKAADGSQYTGSESIACKWLSDASGESGKWVTLDGSEIIAFDLSDNLKNTQDSVISFDVSVNSMGTVSNDNYYDRKVTDKGNFESALNYYLGVTYDYDWIKHYYSSWSSSWFTFKQVLESYSSLYVGLRVTVNYNHSEKVGEEEVVTVESMSFDFFDIGTLDETYVKDTIYKTIMKGLGLSPKEDGTYDETKLITFSLDLYSTAASSSEAVGKLHYDQNEVGQVVDYYRENEAVFDFTEIIEKSGGADDTYAVTLKDGRGNTVKSDTLERDANGRFILRIPGQSVGSDYEFSITGDVTVSGTIDNLGGAGITSISSDVCKNQLSIDFNAYIKEFERESRGNRDIDTDKLIFNIYVDDVFSTSFKLVDDAVLNIDGVAAGEVKDIRIEIVKNDEVLDDETGKDIKAGIAYGQIDGGTYYIYDLSSMIGSIKINDTSSYSLWVEVEGKKRLLEANKTGAELKDLSVWIDKNDQTETLALLDSKEIKFFVTEKEDGKDFSEVIKSLTIDTRLIEKDSGIDFSALLSELDGKEYITGAADKNNIKYLIENITTGNSVTVSVTEDDRIFENLGSIGDTFNVTVLEDNIILKDGDTWQVSGDDTSIVSIKTALNTQHIQKTDDKIALRSDSFGIFGGDFSTGTVGQLLYHEVTLPGDTKNYTIWAENTLVVESDLAGKIETNTNAINFGYRISADHYAINDGTSRSVISVSVKAQNLELKNNFRADIDNRNSSESMAIAQKYTGENIYDENGELEGEDKTFRVAFNDTVNPCDKEYSKTTIFTTYDEEKKENVEVELKDIIGNPFVFNGNLYYETKEGMKEVKNVSTNGSYDDTAVDYRSNFIAGETYVAEYAQIYIQNEDGSWDYYGTGSIELISGVDYENGDLIRSSKTMEGPGLVFYEHDVWSSSFGGYYVYGDRYALRNNVDIVVKNDDGSLTKKTAKVLYKYDFYDVAIKKDSTPITGTWLSAYDYSSNTAADNKVENMGFDVAGTLSQKDGIWGGDINIETSDAYIGANWHYIAVHKDRTADIANAGNNKIGAYGLKVDGTADIRKIDQVALDNDGSYEGVKYQNPKITVAADDNKIEALAYNDNDTVDRAILSNSTVTAAAIYAGTLKIDTVTDKAFFDVRSNNNTFIFNRHSLNDIDIKGAGVKTYGIYANNATFRDFDGTIVVESLNNKIQYFDDEEGSASDYKNCGIVSAGIYVTGTLTSNCNLNGDIIVDAEAVAYGIYANNITVKGAIDTDMIVTGFGISAENKITAAGFTGEIYSVIGINTDLAESNVANDSFDIGGYINANVAFTSTETINLRVSGVIEAVDSISGETNYSLGANENVITYYSNVANRDYVELTGTANVTGDIDLRKGINNYSISSNATFVGNILDSDGQANIVYHLEGTPDAGHITHTINSYDDQTIYSTNVITLNVNYAEIGKNYQLIKYDLADGDAEKYWRDREIAVMYQGRTVTFKLNQVVEQVIPDDMTGEYTAAGAGDVQVISVAGVLAGANFSFPETSGIQFGIEYYLLDDKGNKTGVGGYTTTQTGADGERYFTVSGVEEGQKIGYTIVTDGVNHSYYIGSTTFKDANGSDVTITGTFTTDTDIFSVELSGKDGVSLAPVTPEISFEKLAKAEDAPAETVVAGSKYDEKKDALTLSWNHQTAAQYGLVEIYAYEVEYIVFDQDGKALSNSLATRVVGGNSLTIDGIDENMSVRWRIRMLGSSSASMSSGWSEWNTDYSALKVTGDAGKSAVSVIYDKDKNTITLQSKDAATINYTVYGANNQHTTAKDVVMIKRDGSEFYELVIKNVDAGSEFRYQVANCLDTREYIQDATKEGEESKLVQEIVGWQSIYSDSYHIADLSDPANKILISFDYSNFTSQVIDANYNEREQVGVIGSMAHISFESLESDIPVRNYIIEYCPVTEQVTLDDVRAAGAESIDDYIANYLGTIAANNNASIYTKTFTGTALDISEIQNQTYVYWRIKAVDANGYESDWVAGDTFRVWANAEGDKYKPNFGTDVKHAVIGLDYNPAASDNFESKTELVGNIGWTKAEDSDSGVKNYVIEFYGKDSEPIVKTIGAEYNTPAVVGTYEIGLNDYSDGDRFTVMVDGTEVEARILEVKDEVTGEITGYTLKWEKIDSRYDGVVTVYKNGNEFVADLASGENGYTATVYDYLFDFKGLTGSNYNYTIYAVDYFGNKSASFSGSFSVDNGDPTNLATTVRTVVDDDSVSCSIYWCEASDDNEELGIRYYNVRYREVGTDEWIETRIAQGNENYIVEEGEEGFIEGFNYIFSFQLDANEKKSYEYEVIAYDYFENSTTVTGKFGSVDIAAPTGSFKPDAFKSEVDAVYKTVTVEKEVVDEEGNTTIVTETITGALDYASVRLSWDGEFRDQSSLRYVVEVSDDKTFKSDKTYSFWTNGSEKYMDFNNSTPGRPVGIFEGMSTVYWRVTVADEYFNTSATGAIQSFTFTDEETGNAIITNEKPSAPFGLLVENREMVDGVHTGKNISLSWRSNNELLGVYSYNIELIDNATGKVVASYSTVDKNEYQSTDINQIVTVSSAGDVAVMRVNNLNTIFAAGDKLADGNYKVKITAVDGKGRVSEAGEVTFTQDTTAPRIVVNKVKTYLLPGGENVTGTSIAQFLIDWSEAAKSGSKDIVRYEIWETVDDPASDNAKWIFVTDTEDTSYSTSQPISVRDTYHYKIVAYDAAGNKSPDDMWNATNILEFTPANAKDGYNGSFAPATLLNFDSNGRAIMPEKEFELAGNGDNDCIYFKTGGTSESLTLTVNELNTVYGAASNIKLEIFKGSSNNLWKTFTVSGNGRVFSDLLLDADTTYYYRITAIKNESVVAYNFVWDKAVIGVVGKDAEGKDISGFNTNDDSAKGAGKLAVNSNVTKSSDWVGYGDKVDYKKLDITDSGKYNITLGGVASSVTIALIERIKNANGTFTEKSIGTATAKESDLNGKTISNAILDANKEYYLKVTSGNANSVGTQYDVTIDRVAAFEEATTEDDARSKELALLGETKSGWVGFGDATDFYRLEVGEYGGAYNFTIEHDGTESEAVKLVVYEQLTGVNKYRTVKTVTLAKNAASISTGELYLTGANGGTYYVEVTATGAAKAQNSHYKVTADGYNLPGDEDGTSLYTMTELNGSVSDCWVGIGDNADYYYISADEIKVNGYYYTLTLDGTNGNQIKAAIGYENPKGTFVALQTVTGAANSDSLTLSRQFTDADIAKLTDGKLIIKVFAANTTTANSKYTVSWNENKENDKLLGEIKLADSNKSGWVGVGDNADYYYIDGIAANGSYTLTLDGTNGNQIKAAIGYENPKGTFVALQTVTGAANSDSLTLSRQFTDADIAKLTDGKLIIKVFAANTTTADSYYTVSWEQNTLVNGDDALTKGKAFVSADDSFGSISVAGGKTGWVGLGDAADHMIVDIDSNGYYCFNLSDVENNLTVNLYEVTLDADGNILSSAKKSSANATTSADGKLYWALDAGKKYAVGVNNGGAAKGLNSSYDLSLEKVASLTADAKDQKVSVAEPKAYVLGVGAGEAGIRSFKLDNIEGGLVKVSICNAATNKVVKTFTSKAGADFLSFSYNFAEGNYMIKVEAADKNGFDKSFDLSFAERSADGNDVIVGKATKADPWIEIDNGTSITDGWVGLNDSTDFIRLDLEGATGSYNIGIDGLDNNVVLSLLEVTAWNANDTVKTTKTIKSLTVNAVKGGGLLKNMMLDSSKTYFVQVKAANSTGSGDSGYHLTMDLKNMFSISTFDDGEFTTDQKFITGKGSLKAWVGFGDAKDCFVFGTDNNDNTFEAANISVSLKDYTGTGDLKVEIVQHNSSTGRETVVKTMTLSSKAMIAHFGDMLLDANSQYSIRVTAPKAATGVNADYSVTVDQYNLSDFESGDNVIGNAQEFKVGETRTGAVWLTSAKDDVDDNVDFYTITIAEGNEGNYTFDLAGISGNNIKITIGTENPQGAFKALQGVTGVAGKDELILTRNLAAGTYLVKVENTGANKASRYELTATRNEDKTGLFNTGDDTWKLVADNTESKGYGKGDSITDWVGLGDASDVFKVNLDANGQVTFECDEELQEAIAGKGASVTLLDSNGKSVALTYDSANGIYTSKNILCAGVDYYLNVKNSNTAKFSIDYEIGIAIK